MPLLVRRLAKPTMFAITAMLIASLVWKNWSQFQHAVTTMRVVPANEYVLPTVLVALGFCFAALSYAFLALRRVRLNELLVVELAAACINRIVPSGLGGMGVHGLYLHRRKHTVAQAATIASVNNLLGMTTHAVLLVSVVMFVRPPLTFHVGLSSRQVWISLGVVIAMLVSLAYSSTLRQYVRHFVAEVKASLRTYATKPYKLSGAVIALVALTAANVAILYLVGQMFDITIGIAALFIVYSAGVLLGAAVPTPGGLAGVEAGLAGGLIAYGVPSSTAIAVALTFRLLTYWLPLLPGAAALYYSRRKHFL